MRIGRFRAHDNDRKHRVGKTAFWHPGRAVLLVALGSAVWLAGCTDKAAEPVQAPAEPEKTKLKITYFSPHQFMKDYGDSLKKLLPDIEFEVIPSIDTTGGAAKSIEHARLLEQKPDLLGGSPLIQEANKSGQTLDLTGLIKQDGFDLGVFHELALEQMRFIGGGKLTALSPIFVSTATFYNKDLFDRFGVAYPTNNTSWTAITELAKHFAKSQDGKQYYGIYSATAPSAMLPLYATGVGASFVSNDRKSVNYTTGAQRAAATALLDGYLNHAFYLPPQTMPRAANKKETLLRNKFIAGEAAITFSNPGLLATMADAAKENIPSFKWDLVAEPVDPADPNRSVLAVYVSDSFAITSDSPNKAAAWKVLRTIVSAEMAAELAKTKVNALSTRKDSPLVYEGRKLDAFYSRSTQMGGSAAWSRELAQRVSDIQKEETDSMLYDGKTLDAGLAALQLRVQQAVDEMF